MRIPVFPRVSPHFRLWPKIFMTSTPTKLHILRYVPDYDFMEGFRASSYLSSSPRSASSGLRSSCQIHAASSSSLLISLDQLIAVHDAIILSTGMMGFCPYISSVGMYPITELWVVRSAHSAYGSNLGQLLTRPSHAHTMAFTIGLWPRSIFPFSSGLYVIVRDSFTPNRSNSSSASSASSSPRSATIFPTHPYRHMTCCRGGLVR